LSFRNTAVSSSITENYLRLHRSTVHPLIAISLPSFFLLCVDSIARAVFPALTFPPPLFFLVLLAVGAEETVMANVFVTERAGFLARIRELLAVLLAVWLAIGAIHGLQTHVFTLLHVDFVYPLCLTFFQWTCVWVLHKCLREREILLSAIAGRKGEDMLHALRDASLQAEISARSLRAVKVVEALFQAVAFILLLLSAALKAPIGSQVSFLAAVHALFGLLATGTMNMYVQDQLLLGEGIVVPARFEWSRMGTIAAVPLVSIPLVLLLARNDAPLPLSALLSFLERLFRSFPALPFWALMDPVRIFEEQQRYAAMAQAVSGSSPSPGFLLFLFVLGRLIRIALVMGIYFFLVSPLLSADFLASVRTRSFGSFVRRKLNDFLHACRRLMRRLRTWLTLVGRSGSGREYADAKKNVTRASYGPAPHALPWRKRLQMSRVLRAYLQLLEWGESSGVPHRACDAPCEYASRLASAFPDRKGQLELVAEILEEVLFSTHLLPGVRMAAYFSMIREIKRRAERTQDKEAGARSPQA
jgi:hypothetical protein